MDNRNDRNNNRQQGRRPQHNNGQQEEKLFSELISLRRVTKVTSGAKRLRFSVVLIAGDKKGKVGIAMGKGADPQEAMQKAMKRASVKLFQVPLAKEGKTIPHRVEAQYKASSVMIKPAPVGTGVVAGGAIRKVLEMAGVENVVAKRLGGSNTLTNAYCAMIALTKLKEKKHGSKSQEARS